LFRPPLALLYVLTFFFEIARKGGEKGKGEGKVGKEEKKKKPFLV